MTINFNLNGANVEFDAEANTRLLEILRSKFLITSVKCSCLQGYCGACTVLLNDIPVTSCMIPVSNVSGQKVVTLEYFSQIKKKEYRKIMSAFKRSNVKMCGYCNSGKIFTAYQILKMKIPPSKKQIKEMFEGQICRCSVTDSLIEAMEKLNS